MAFGFCPQMGPSRKRYLSRRGVSGLLWCLGLLLALPGAPGAGSEGPLALYEAGRFDEARAAFEARLQVHPEALEALYYLGRLTPEGAKARRYFERLLAIDPQHDLADDALFELAEADYAGPGGRYLRARNRYRQFLIAYPQSPLVPKAHYRIGLTFLVTMQPDSAGRAFQQAMAFPGSEIVPYARLGAIEAMRQEGRRGDALKAAERLADDVPSMKATRLKKMTAPTHAARQTGVQHPKKNERFWVQVGAFRNQKNLQDLVSRLKAAGFRVQVETHDTNGLTFVMVGGYPDRADAEADRKRIERMAHLHCTVKERP